MTGALYHSLDRGEAGNIYAIGSDEIIYGTAATTGGGSTFEKAGVPYAFNTQYGIDAPERPILADASDNVIKIASEWHAKAVEAAANL